MILRVYVIDGNLAGNYAFISLKVYLVGNYAFMPLMMYLVGNYY